MTALPRRRRCLWTGTRSDRVVEITVPGVDRLGRPAAPVPVSVLPEHESDMRAYAEMARRSAGRFLGGLLALTVAVVGAAVLGGADVLPETASRRLVGLGVGLMGVLILRYPLITPETSALFGIRRGIAIARAAGVLTVAAGLVLALVP